MTSNLRKIFFLFTLLFFASSLTAQKIEYSRDGQTIVVNWVVDVAVGDDFSQFLFYDLKTGKLKSSFNSAETPNSIIFSNDSKTLVIGERLLLEKIGIDQNGKSSLLENPVSTENFLIDSKFQDEINAEFLGLAISSDGKTLYKLFPNFLNAYSFPDLKFQPEKSRSIKLKDAAPQNNFLAISRDGSVVVESEYAEKTSLLVVKEDGKARAKMEFPKIKKDEEFPFISGIISQNNETLLLRSTFNSGISSHIGFWDLKKHASLGTFSFPPLDSGQENQAYMLDAAAISPDGKKAAISFNGIWDGEESVSMIAVYDIAAKKSVVIKVKSEAGSRFAELLAFSPDSKQIATLSTVLLPGSLTAKIQIWDAETGKLIRQFE